MKRQETLTPDEVRVRRLDVGCRQPAHAERAARELWTDHDQAREDVKRLADELEECMAVVAIFHGPSGLAVYTANAPEMKRWRALLAEVRR